MSMKEKECWYCYVCGKPIGDNFTLLNLAGSTDRVFLAHNDCSQEADPETIFVEVMRVKRNRTDSSVEVRP